METNHKIGDLQVWWIPQVPGKPFTVTSSSLAEAGKILDVLADYDSFQFENLIKPDYCNAGGLQVWCADDGDGKPGWKDWHDDETGDDFDEWRARSPGRSPSDRDD
jgi:hypothetical protein